MGASSSHLPQLKDTTPKHKPLPDCRSNPDKNLSDICIMYEICLNSQSLSKL